MTELVDLSQELYSDSPSHPTLPETKLWERMSHETTRRLFREQLGEDPPFSYRNMVIHTYDHASTHVDAMGHMDPEGAAIDEMSLDSFHGPGTAIDVSGRPSRHEITTADLEAAAEDAGVVVEAGDVLLVRTGHYEDHYPGREYVTDVPALRAEATEWIADRGAKAFGIDQPSPDPDGDITFPSHAVCRDRGLHHFENLRNIGEVVGKRFEFMGFPLKIRNGSASPVRAVAKLSA